AARWRAIVQPPWRAQRCEPRSAWTRAHIARQLLPTTGADLVLQNHAYRMVGVEPWSTLRHVCALMAGTPMGWPQALVGPRHSALQSPSPMTHTFEFETREDVGPRGGHTRPPCGKVMRIA